MKIELKGSGTRTDSFYVIKNLDDTTYLDGGWVIHQGTECCNYVRFGSKVTRVSNDLDVARARLASARALIKSELDFIINNPTHHDQSYARHYKAQYEKLLASRIEVVKLSFELSSTETVV